MPVHTFAIIMAKKHVEITKLVLSPEMDIKNEFLTQIQITILR